MPESVMTTTTDAVFIPTIVAQKCLQKFGSYLSLAKTVARDSDYSTAKVGTVLKIPKTGAVTANTKVAGVAYTKQNPTGSEVSVTLDTHKEVTFTIDDVDALATNQNTQERYANDGAIALAEAVETAIASLHPQITSTITWDRSSTTTIDATMLKVRKYFTDNKVPKLEQRYLYVDGTVMNDLLSVDKFTRVDARGANDAIANGQVVKTYGIEASESQLIQVTGSPVAYHNLAYTRDAFVLASRPLQQPKGFGGESAVINDPSIGVAIRSLYWYNADLGAQQLTLDLLFGVGVLDQRRVVEVESF